MIQEHNTRRQVEKEKRKWYRLKKKKGNPSNHFNESNRKIPNTKMSN